MLQLLSLYLPVLFPSWRFFDQLGPSPRIEVRLAGETDWRDLCARPERLGFGQMLVALVYSPDRNEQLFLVSLATRLAIEPCDQMGDLLIRRIQARLAPTRGTTYQFRVCFLAREDGRIGQFVDFESGVLPVVPSR